MYRKRTWEQFKVWTSSLFTKHQLFSNVQFLQNQFPLQDNVEYDNSDEGVVAISKENLRIVAGCNWTSCPKFMTRISRMYFYIPIQ